MTHGASRTHLGSWHWDPVARRLRIEIDDSSEHRDLRGSWSLEGVSALLDGFAPSRLAHALSGEMTAVNCPLGRSDGRRIQLVGAFLPHRAARGLLLGASGEHAGRDHTLVPAYQPIVSLETGELSGFEALARWIDKDGKPDPGVAPGDDEGLAAGMLLHGASALSRWRRLAGGEALFVQVNLTGRDLEQPGLPGLIEALIEGHGLPPGMLKVELTEQAPLRDAGDALRAARAIKAAGAGLVLDDFGTGHSSFAWLADLPADGLKIDADLISRLGEPRIEAILEAVTRLAHRFGLTVTAEGVEARTHIARLRGLGFDHVQGFAFGRPMPEEAVSERIRWGEA